MATTADLTLFPPGTTVNSAGRLAINGQDLEALAREYGTPLYLYDAATIRGQAGRLAELFKRYYPGQALIAYAAKAYFSPFLAQKLQEMGVGVDVVSLGEMQIARQAGFSAGAVHLHGNNKSVEELTAALDWEIQAIVVDNLEELELLEDLAAQAHKKARVWLRITPDIEIHTHPHIATGHSESKFGLHTTNGEAAQAIQMALTSPVIELAGLHTHLGSQITEVAPYQLAVQILTGLVEETGYIPAEISPGGGWGVRYLPGDPSDDPQQWVQTVSGAVQEACIHHDWPTYPRLVLEPGRWLVARAGVAIYQVGMQKTTATGKHLIAIDGGLADNPRVALYQARYTAVPVKDPLAAVTDPVSIVGRYCESGDVLIPEISLPPLQRGDYLAVPAAGAYQLSMASNYNMAPRPTVLWLDAGKVEVMQTRENPAGPGWWQNRA